jgi:hypothetical protein
VEVDILAKHIERLMQVYSTTGLTNIPS